MGSEEILWREAYESTHCYDCLNFERKRGYSDMIACQWRKWEEAFEGSLENESDQ